MINFDDKFKEKGITSMRSIITIFVYTFINSHIFLLNLLYQKGILSDTDFKDINDDMERNFDRNADTIINLYNKAMDILKEKFDIPDDSKTNKMIDELLDIAKKSNLI